MVFALGALVPMTSYAADCTSASDCVSTGLGASGASSSSAKTMPEVVGSIINILLFVIGAVAVIMIIIGGLRYVMSQGDSASVQAAKNTILYSVIGLVVSMLASAIVNFVVNSMTGGGGSASTPSSSTSQSQTSTSTAPPRPKVAAPVQPKPTTSSTPPASGTQYRNGPFTVTKNYAPKGLPDKMTVTLTIQNDKVSAVSIVDNPSDPKSAYYVDRFKSTIKAAVVGKSLSSLSVSPSQVGGASLTAVAFNDAVKSIRANAKA